jgi:hypothetical protein
MSEAERARLQAKNWLQNLIDASISASKSKRMAQWNDGFTANEAEAALKGSYVLDTAGGEILLSSLLSLVLEGDDPTPRYPRWQFEPVVLRYLPVLQNALSTLDKWTRHSFFLENNELLQMTPVNALRAGMHRQVFAAAVAANDDY